jgi:SAM-dependent methyltransferase
MNQATQERPFYVLGHSSDELSRLDRQGAFLRAPTLGLFRRAGIQPGMRVLDFGCGTGDVAVLAAELVGPGGDVVGVDRSAAAVSTARARVAAKGLAQARFVEGDEDAALALGRERPFDALVGRLVLIHQRDPVATLERLARAVRPGGIVAFLEIDIEAGYWSSHPNPLLEQTWRWVRGLASRQLFPGQLGRMLHEGLARAGAAEPIVTREGLLAKARDPLANAWIAGFARSIAEPVRKLGIGSDADQSIDALLAALHADPESERGFSIGAHLVAANGILPNETPSA